MSTPTPFSGMFTNSSAAGLSRSDSVESLDSDHQSIGYGTVLNSSRGPSPMTVGLSEVPLAMAITETIHAWFKGNDDS